MRRFFSVVSVVLLLAVLTVPATAADLQGGYYFVADCSLGTGVKFYVPADYATGSLTYDSSGHLFNLTASSIYLYCPDYPGYTIYAPRFSGFQYRTGSGYDYAALNVANVTETNVQILDADPGKSLVTSEVLMIIVVLLLVLIGCFVILRR